MKLTTNVHTIFLTVGPTGAGKTTFVQQVLLPELKKHSELNVQYLSSDDIRQELLGHNYNKYDAAMTESSVQAFDVLFTKLNALTSFPIHAEFVVVNTTGLSEEFREKVRSIAKEKQYAVELLLFDFKEMNEYYAPNREKKLISKQVTRFRREVLPSIRKNEYKQFHYIKNRNFLEEENQVIIENYEFYKSHFLPQEQEYVVLFDVHECLEELKEAIESHGFLIDSQEKMTPQEKKENKRFVLGGDFLDKGKNTKGIVEFLAKNQEWFYFILGNHENYVQKFLKGELKEKPHSFFDSISVFQNEPDLKDKFLTLMEKARTFYCIKHPKRSTIYLTHAPCENRYLGKVDANSQKNQRSFRLNETPSPEEQLSFLKKEAVGNHPLHLFGHIATKEAYRVLNKWGLDTGVVYGNKLTTVVFDGVKPFFKTIPSHKARIEKELFTLFPQKKKIVDLTKLEEEEKKRLRYIVKNRINYISGTMSPAEKDEEKQELESLEKGLEYFKKKGNQFVVLQPKYMGSRCNLYLFKNEEECFATTRKGHKIHHLDLSSVYKETYEKMKDFMEKQKLEMILLDGELLPWSALGKGLIEEQFKVVEQGIHSELAFLKENGFEEALKNFREKYEENGFDVEQNQKNKEKLIEKYGYERYRTYKNWSDIKSGYMPLSVQEKALQVYQEQIDWYGKENPLEFKPFAILKMVGEDGKETFPEMKSSDMFALLNGDEYLVLDLANEDAYQKAQAFYATLTTERKMEGVVIKPETWIAGEAPYLKVRNKKYLTLVYGYDYLFPKKYQKLLKQKNIGSKLKTSISEYRLGLKMLAHPLMSISPENGDFQQDVANLLFETTKEKGIDPRL